MSLIIECCVGDLGTKDTRKRGKNMVRIFSWFSTTL